MIRISLFFLMILGSNFSLADEELFRFRCTDPDIFEKQTYYDDIDAYLDGDGKSDRQAEPSKGYLELIVNKTNLIVIKNSKEILHTSIKQSNVKLDLGGSIELYDNDTLQFRFNLFELFAHDVERFGSVYQYFYSDSQESTDEIQWYCAERSNGKFYKDTDKFLTFLVKKLELNYELPLMGVGRN